MEEKKMALTRIPARDSILPFSSPSFQSTLRICGCQSGKRERLHDSRPAIPFPGLSRELAYGSKHASTFYAGSQACHAIHEPVASLHPISAPLRNALGSHLRRVEGNETLRFLEWQSGGAQ